MEDSFIDEFPDSTNVEYGVGFSDVVLMTISVVGLCVLSVTMYSIMKIRFKAVDDDSKLEANESYDERLARQTDTTGLNRSERRLRARALMKQRRRIAPTTVVPDEQEQESDQEDVDSLAPSTAAAIVSRRERQKAAKELERLERKRNEDVRRQQQQETLETIRKEKILREAEHAKRLEDEREKERLRRLQQKQDDEVKHATFLSSTVHTLSVDDWIRELSEKRIVVITDIAQSFQVAEQAVVDRIQELIQERRVAGIFESGSFIYFSESELEELSQAIQALGIVSFTDIANLCNSRINAQSATGGQ